MINKSLKYLAVIGYDHCPVISKLGRVFVPLHVFWMDGFLTLLKPKYRICVLYHGVIFSLSEYQQCTRLHYSRNWEFLRKLLPATWTKFLMKSQRCVAALYSEMFTMEKRKKGKWKCYVANQEVISQNKFCLASKCFFCLCWGSTMPTFSLKKEKKKCGLLLNGLF